MFTAEQYRAKAAEYRGLLDNPRSPSETKEFGDLERTYAAMADNQEWLARNTDRVVSAFEYDIVPASETDQNKRFVLIDEEEHFLRCLGAAVMMRWSTLPAKLQRELFDHAGALDDFDRDAHQRSGENGQVERADSSFPSSPQRRADPLEPDKR